MSTFNLQSSSEHDLTTYRCHQRTSTRLENSACLQNNSQYVEDGRRTESARARRELHNQGCILFTRLSAELRLRIYDFATPNVLTVPSHSYAANTGVFETCRPLRNEAFPVFWSTTETTLSCTNTLKRGQVACWLQTSPLVTPFHMIPLEGSRYERRWAPDGGMCVVEICAAHVRDSNRPAQAFSLATRECLRDVETIKDCARWQCVVHKLERLLADLNYNSDGCSVTRGRLRALIDLWTEP